MASEAFLGWRGWQHLPLPVPRRWVSGQVETLEEYMRNLLTPLPNQHPWEGRQNHFQFPSPTGNPMFWPNLIPASSLNSSVFLARTVRSEAPPTCPCFSHHKGPNPMLCPHGPPCCLRTW